MKTNKQKNRILYANFHYELCRTLYSINSKGNPIFILQIHVQRIIELCIFLYLRVVISSWAKDAVRFCSNISGELKPLDFLPELSDEFIEVLEKHTKILFPVQQTVLPFLLRKEHEVFPSRDAIICSPTGSGKTLCFVIPILEALRTAKSVDTLFALIIVPMQNLIKQIYKVRI